jgi:hypothetical protein
MNIELLGSGEEQLRNLATKQGRDVRTLVESGLAAPRIRRYHGP